MTKKTPKNIYRQRVVEAIVFFSRKLKKPNKTIIYKSLAMLDFRHFAATGLPVTDLQYHAYRWGPVPDRLQKEITVGKNVVLPDDFKEALVCMKTEYDKADGTTGIEFTFKSKRKPNLEIFTPRQIKIMDEVADIHQEVDARVASDASHERDTPWFMTVNGLGGEGALIDMVETVRLVAPLTKEIVKEKLREWRAVVYNYASSGRA